MNIRCSIHRLLPWLGHGECLACDRTFKHILEAEDVCSCGQRLLPFGKLKVEGLFQAINQVRTFYGRPLCAKCYESRQVSGVPTTVEEAD